MNNFLEEILSHKKSEVALLKTTSLAQKKIKKSYNGKFKKTLSSGPSGRVIAEIKRRSPSKGLLAEILDVASLATCYQRSSAAAISVLTDQQFFSGSLEDLQTTSRVLQYSNCAVLRKDFIIDTIQLTETVEHGADAVLLIAGVLQDQLAFFIETAKTLGLDTLVEVHDDEECLHAIKSGAEIIGINHRDLCSFHMHDDRAIALLKLLPKNIIKVAESGIHSKERAAELCLAGFDAVLIGEALVTAKQPDLFIRGIQKLCVPE